MLYMYGMSRVVEKSSIQNSVNSTENCVHYMYGMSERVEKVNIQNSENSTGNCVRYIRTECLD